LNERKSNLSRSTDAITSNTTEGLSSVNSTLDSKAFLKILVEGNPDVTLGDIVRELVKNVGPVTLIIDEANAEFSNEPEKRVECQNALRLFTSLTKVKKLVSRLIPTIRTQTDRFLLFLYRMMLLAGERDLVFK
jgi:hypothetical protein